MNAIYWFSDFHVAISGFLVTDTLLVDIMKGILNCTTLKGESQGVLLDSISHFTK